MWDTVLWELLQPYDTRLHCDAVHGSWRTQTWLRVCPLMCFVLLCLSVIVIYGRLHSMSTFFSVLSLDYPAQLCWLWAVMGTKTKGAAAPVCLSSISVQLFCHALCLLSFIHSFWDPRLCQLMDHKTFAVCCTILCFHYIKLLHLRENNISKRRMQ